MLWIRNVDALTSTAAVETIEAELASEVEISGLLAYENDAVLCARATFQPDARGLHKYQLKLRFPLSPKQLPEATAEGYLFHEGPVGELAALFSLQLQARIFILSTTSGQLSPHGTPVRTEYEPNRGRFGPEVDGVVFGELDRKFASSLPSFLDRIRIIPAKHHLRVALSAHHYARALREIGVDDEMVFVRLVSAIETAARDQPIPEDPLVGKVLSDLIKTESLSELQREELERMFRVRRTKARFVAFLEQYSVGFFENEPTEPAHTQVTPGNLAVVAGAIYDARSAYLHSGTTMYLSSRIRGYPQWHMDPSVGMLWQNRRFKAEQKLPRIEFFHRLVRYCLLRFFISVESPPTA